MFSPDQSADRKVTFHQAGYPGEVVIRLNGMAQCYSQWGRISRAMDGTGWFFAGECYRYLRDAKAAAETAITNDVEDWT